MAFFEAGASGASALTMICSLDFSHKEQMPQRDCGKTGMRRGFCGDEA